MAEGIFKSIINFFKKIGGFFVEIFRRIIKAVISIVSTVIALYETIIDYIIDGIVEVWCIVFAKKDKTSGRLEMDAELSIYLEEHKDEAGKIKIDWPQAAMTCCRNKKTGEVLKSSIQAMDITELSSLNDDIIETARNSNGVCRITSENAIAPMTC